jgi:DNA-binding response OmpR family regulator
MYSGSAKILVVDDCPVVRETVKVLLVGQGFSVVQATDGDEAIMAAVRERPDLILMDVNMRRISGLNACRALRQHPTFRDTPIVLLTSEADADTIVRSLAAGANDYVLKTAPDEEVLARIRRHLSVYTSYREQVTAERLMALGQIALSVQHEINNPLTSVIGLLELSLRNPEIPVRVRDYLERAKADAQRIGLIVERITSVEDRPVDPYGVGPMIDLKGIGNS